MKAAMSKPARPGSIRLAGVSGDTEMIVNGECELYTYSLFRSNAHPFSPTNIQTLSDSLTHTSSHSSSHALSHTHYHSSH